ncbi:MAG: ATP-binding protein [Gammaproteobacteria bacterium]|nr:ATP-binding protein [Gammaproteobacteria bacterium]
MPVITDDELDTLKQRLEFLETINQQYISTLDTLNSLGDIYGNVKQKRRPEHIFSSARQYVNRLARFETTAFLMVNEADNSFELKDCFPQTAATELQLLVDQLIESGEFGWALNQSRVCQPQLKPQGKTIYLHVLASRTRIRGMFVGVMAKDEAVPSVMTLGLVSAILYNSAYALESAALYKLLINDNQDLEAIVAERTQALNHAQFELRKSNEELEARVKLRTAELLAANQQLIEEVERRKESEKNLRESENNLIAARQLAESANHAKSEFLSKMSHELRTPLNAILGFSQVMELSVELMNSDNAYFVDEIRTAGEHLLDLINEVLDLAKIESGKVDINRENVNLAEVIRESNAMVIPQAKKKNVFIHEVSEPFENVCLYADRTLVKQVFINLLSNAVKYNTDGGKVEVKVAIADNLVEIRIADNGIGIKPEMQQHMFQPFNRLGIESSEIEGTGMGMVITKHLVELLGGTIEFDSEFGIGTEFCVRLPPGFSSFSPAKAKINNAPAMALKIDGFSVLYIENDAPNIRLMESILSKWPQITLASAMSAEAGIKLAEDMQPDVIIMDINLPKMNGYDAVKVLKQQEKTALIPVIALSANAMEKSMKDGLDSGFVRYLTKPLKVVEFLKLLGSLTGQALLQ